MVWHGQVCLHEKLFVQHVFFQICISVPLRTFFDRTHPEAASEKFGENY